MAWQVQEAKQRFSEVVRRALADGPQVVTRHGEEVVVVLSATEYRRLTDPPMAFKDYLRAAPDLSILEEARPMDTPARGRVVTYLLDTNVLSEVRKPAADRHVTAWFDAIPPADLYISVMAIGEIRRGIELLRRRRDLAQADALERWLTGLRGTYRDRVVPVTAEVAEAWGRLSVPDPLPLIDGLLAATAMVHGWTLVTRNTGHMARTGVRVLNPFDPPAR